MPGTNSPVHSHSEIIARAAARADTAAALLSVLEKLPQDARQVTLTTCLALTEDVVRDLTVLVGGAA